MALILLKKMALLFLLLSPPLLSISWAGGRETRFSNKLAEGEGTYEVEEEGEVEANIHERLLRTNSKDYGRYDPAPALRKPPFKLIPN